MLENLSLQCACRREDIYSKGHSGCHKRQNLCRCIMLDYNFTMIDTGGIEPESGDVILSQMREQAQIAIDTADVIIFITDVKQGLFDCRFKGGRYASPFTQAGCIGCQ